MEETIIVCAMRWAYAVFDTSVEVVPEIMIEISYNQKFDYEFS